MTTYSSGILIVARLINVPNNTTIPERLLVDAVVNRLKGAIIYSEDINPLLLTCEAYCCSKSVDVHAETSMKLVPLNRQSIFVGVYEESDGHGMKDKLKIGGYHINVLSTMSADIGTDFGINIGPSTNMPASSSLSIRFPESNIKKFKESMEAAIYYTIKPNSNSIWQLVSGFGNISTYKPFRTSMYLLKKHETLMPATVFNFCGFPGNRNYGVSDSAASVISSKFLNLMASSILLNLPIISKAWFNDSIFSFNAYYKMIYMSYIFTPFDYYLKPVLTALLDKYRFTMDKSIKFG